jgi:hypothetical protein
MIELSGDTRARLLGIFREQDTAEAERLLAEDCGETLPLIGNSAMPIGLERIRFAALRVSGGDLRRLRGAVQLAHTDWRDLLVSAQFAEDINAHRKWQPRRFDSATADAWMAGSTPEGVEFRLNDSVEILAGPRRGMKGAIVSLVGLEPEPRYLVETVSGEDNEEFQQTLRAAG